MNRFIKFLNVVLFLFGLNLGLFAQQNTTIDLVKFCAEQKGFNLLGKFDVSWSNTGYKETEFKLINQLGFNFVRLPIDYRTYTAVGDWNKYLENEIIEIDRAVEWGQENKVHVCINLHRAPGYCVNAATLPANQQLNLWTDTAAQNAFVRHWELFANRYKEIATDQLSFNLVNEPSNVSEAQYMAVMKMAINAIHTISPGRIIFVDGLNYGREILPSLKDEPNIAQSMHCYDPFGLTHYKAEWVSGSDLWPLPQWPMLWISSYLYGPWKPDYKSPLIIEGNFPSGTEVIVNVRQVSIEATLQVKANTKIILSKKFVCGAELGDDFTVIVKTEWGYQNISNKDFACSLAADATRLTFENSNGDWMILNSITIKNGNTTHTYNLSDDTWGKKQSSYKIDGNGKITAMDGSDLLPFDVYRKNVTLAKENNIPFMVQEFGVHNKTPHSVAVAFLDDLAQFFYDNNMGWALWNLTGSFGILNSGRTDCTYEDFQGYKLDREMLNALTMVNTGQIDIPEKSMDLLFYLSPAEKSLTIYNQTFSGTCHFSIYDISGRILKTHTVNTYETDSIKLDVSYLKPGVYILKSNSNGLESSGKFAFPE